MRKPSDRVHVAGTTVAERIRAAVERDMRELLAGAPVDESDTTTARDEPPMLELGVDILQMPDGTYALRSDLEAARRNGLDPYGTEDDPAVMIPQHRSLYRMMLGAVLALGKPTPCRHDPQFIADDLQQAEIVELRAKCDACPVLGQCGAYAATARPDAGFWAGREWPPRPPRPPQGRFHPAATSHAKPININAADAAEGRQL